MTFSTYKYFSYYVEQSQPQPQPHDARTAMYEAFAFGVWPNDNSHHLNPCLAAGLCCVESSIHLEGFPALTTHYFLESHRHG